MIYLAYTLGLRPKEISLISLNDIAFAKEEIILPNRKNTTPLRLPLPEEALKAIVAYMKSCGTLLHSELTSNIRSQ